MAHWIRIAALDECPPGSCLERIAADRVVALYNVEGTFHALDGVCPHQGGPLGKGCLTGAIVTCPWHGWQFDVRTGQHQLSRTIVQPRFEVRLDGNDVLVDLGPASPERPEDNLNVSIGYRPFRNSDPPALAEIWRSQPPERGLMQPMSADLFEQMVLAKPYFENSGLIVAVDGDLPVGFVHAAFGPSDDGQRLSTQLGVTCLVMVRLDYQRKGIGAELLARSEAYLHRRGAQVLYAGAIQPLNGFYLGLYGGSELPGVLDSAPRAQYLFKSQGYREIDRVCVLARELAGFRAPVDRLQIQIRRRTVVQVTNDPPARTWWEACTWGGLERTRFELASRDGEGRLATATFWTIEPLAHSWGVRAAGLIELEVEPDHRRQGLATFLLSEALRQLQSQGTSLIEVQTMRNNAAALLLYQKLGFQQIDQGAVFRKE